MRICLFMLSLLLSVAANANIHEHASSSANAIKQPDAAIQMQAQGAATTEVGREPLQNLPSDVRVLVDISGSMKKTDPQNLRKPALDLIVRLVPDKSRAGVWVFGNDVNMLMPHRIVDADWRKEAALKTQKINSIALHTNIGKALKAVSYDRANLNPNFKTHIILLTDGVVDISKEAVDNIKERQRILGEVLSSLKSSGYIIHTIALSADADSELLKKISIATDGVFAIAHTADELTNTFLKIFNQAVPAEHVPLENNSFLIDASVKEFTALIFRKPGVEKTIILEPEGTEYSATSPKDGINWYRTDKYDLITATTPKVGQWKIKTEITPQSRITVLSNLQFVMQPLKGNIRSNDKLGLHYSFQENNTTIANADFLSLLETNVIVVKDGSKENIAFAFDMPEPPKDGVFHQSLNTFSEIGDYEIHVFVDGKTFKREFKHSVNVRDSLLTVNNRNQTTEDGKTIYHYKVTTDEKLVDLSKTKMTVAVKSSKDNESHQELNVVDNHHWEFSFVPEKTGEYNISFHALGEMLDGEVLDETVNAERISYEKNVIVEKSPEHEFPNKIEATTAPEEHKITPTVENNTMLYAVIGVGNFLIALLGFFAYRMFFCSNVKNEIADFEKTLAKDASQSKEKNAEKVTENNTPEELKSDLNEDKSASIPMSDNLGMDTLFPLDDMEDEKNK